MRKDTSKGSLYWALLFNTIWNGMKTHLIRLQCQIDGAPGGTPGLAPNRSTRNYTKTSHLILREMKVFGGVRGKLDFLTSEHPKNCIYVTWVMKRPDGLWEGFYHLRRCLCTEWNSALDIFPETSIWEQSSSLLNQLWFVQEDWKMKWANFQLFFQFFSFLILFTTFFRSNVVHTEGKFSHALCLIQTLTKDFGWFFGYNFSAPQVATVLWHERCDDKYVNIHIYLQINSLYMDSYTYWSPFVCIHLNPAMCLAH